MNQSRNEWIGPRRPLPGPAEGTDAEPAADWPCHHCASSRNCPNVHVCCGGRLAVVIRAPCPEGKIVARSW